MKRADLNIFTSFWFITTLILLLLNDFFLKPLFHNFLTGKLSDFAGLFVFGLFWITLLPKRKQAVLWIIAIAFIFWKSPLANSFIVFWNTHSFFTITRVVDFSDLFALVMLPLVLYYNTNWKNDRQLSINPALPIIVSCFAFAATSQVKHLEPYPYAQTYTYANVYTFNYPLDTLGARVNKIQEANNGYEQAYDTPESELIRFQDSLCGSSALAEVTLHQINGKQSELKITKLTRYCKETEPCPESLLKAFELTIIENLK